MNDASDQDLWIRVLEGDGASFGTLYDRHAGAIRNFCFRRMGNWADSEDICSIVFLETWRRRFEAELQGATIRPWLFGVCINVLRNASRYRTNHAEKLARLNALVRDMPDIADEVSSRLDDEATIARALASLATLSIEDQEVVTLAFWADLSYGEIAEALHVPIGTVRSRLSRAKSRLRELVASPEHLALDGSNRDQRRKDLE